MAKQLQVKMIPIGIEKPFGDLPKMFVLLNNGVRDQAAEGVRFMSTYPPIRDSSYRRTGTLRRSWSFSMRTGGGRIEGEIGSNSNIAPYNREVQGKEQTDLFWGKGWHNVTQLETMIDKDFPKRVQSLIGRAF